MNILDLVRERGLQPKKKASTNGGEYASGCPFCSTGEDRFLIWPERHNKNGDYQGGRYSCRVCEEYGSALSFLIKVDGLSYKDACSVLKVEPKKRDSYNLPKLPAKPNVSAEPSPQWSRKAGLFVEWCHAKLLKQPEALVKIEARGFTTESINQFKLGYNPGDKKGLWFKRDRQEWGLKQEFKENGEEKPLWLPVGLVIPTFSGDGRVIKVKIRNTTFEREIGIYEKAVVEGNRPKRKPQKYIIISGGKECPSVFGNTDLQTALILESEIDALLVQQFAGDFIFCVGLGGSTKPIDAETDVLLRKTKKLLFLPDYDAAGKKSWDKWKKAFPEIQRTLTPSEKSAGDYLLAGGDLRSWLEKVGK